MYMTQIEGFIIKEADVTPDDNSDTINGLQNIITSSNENNGYVDDTYIQYTNDGITTFTVNELMAVNFDNTSIELNVRNFFTSQLVKDKILAYMNLQKGTKFTVLKDFDKNFLAKWNTFKNEISTIATNYKDNLSPNLRIVFRFKYLEIYYVVAYKFNITQ